MRISILKSHVYVIILITMPLIIPNCSRCDRGSVMAEQQQTIVEEYADDDDRFCKNVDIRNNLERLYHIKNCTVITGFLQLVLIERIPPQEFAKFQFPNLR